MDKNQREVRRHQEDAALNRGLMWVGGAVVLECLLLLVNRYYIDYAVSEADLASFVKNVLEIVRMGGPVVGLLSLVWAVFRLRKGERFDLPTVLTLICWALAVCSHVTLVFQESGIQMLFLLVPAWAGLALLYYLYQKEFFLAAVASGFATVGLWFVRFGSGVTLEVAFTLAGIILVAGVALWLKKSDGVIRTGGGKEIQVLSEDTSYIPILASCVVGLIAVVATLIIGANFAYYLIFVMVAWLFALLVYYTVKLM